MEQNSTTLKEGIATLLKLAEKEDVTIETVLRVLAGKGQAVILILMSLPFCFPLQIPGFSTPFGLILAFIGLRIAFGHRIWLPQILLQRKISHRILEKIAQAALAMTNKLQFLIKPRVPWLVQTPILHICHGLMITLMALILAIPLPLPFTNFFPAISILAFGLAIIEDDGYCLTIAYFLAFLCLGFFLALFLFGKAILSSLAFF